MVWLVFCNTHTLLVIFGLAKIALPENLFFLDFGRVTALQHRNPPRTVSPGPRPGRRSSQKSRRRFAAAWYACRLQSGPMECLSTALARIVRGQRMLPWCCYRRQLERRRIASPNVIATLPQNKTTHALANLNRELRGSKKK